MLTVRWISKFCGKSGSTVGAVVGNSGVELTRLLVPYFQVTERKMIFVLLQSAVFIYWELSVYYEDGRITILRNVVFRPTPHHTKI